MNAFTLSLWENFRWGLIYFDQFISQASTNPTKSNPWYNDDCKEAIKQRKQALSKFIRPPNTNNVMTSKYLELKPVEQLNFQSVSHRDLMF